MEQPRALVVSPDPALRAEILGALALREHSALEAEDHRDVARLVREHAVDLVILDAPGSGGEVAALVGEVLDGSHRPVVVAVAGSGVLDLDLIRAGAFDVLPKPLGAALERVVERAARQCELVREWQRLRAALRSRDGHEAIVGHSAPIHGVREQLRRLATSPVAVCLTGEAGTGKEFAARTLHGMSAGTSGAFVAVQCSGLNDSSWEAQWLGAPRGLLAQARGGTLYLEELPDLPPALQVRLVQTLGQRGTPGQADEPRGFRITFSSRLDPLRAIDEGRWSEAIQHELAHEIVRLPPLRERAGDIALLARHFVSTICEINKLTEIRLSPEALEFLERYAWPGNVQELRNAMEQAVILSREGAIRPSDLPDRIGELREGDRARTADRAGRRFREAKREIVDGFERSYLGQLMELHAGNVTAAAQQAGMLRSALQRLLRKHGFRSVSFRKSRRAPGPYARPPVD